MARKRFAEQLKALMVGAGSTGIVLVAAVPARAAVEQREPVVQRESGVRLNIPSQDLRVALTMFARQSRQQLLYSPDLVAGKSSSPLSGRYLPADGLKRLLAHTGIGFRTAPSGAFLLSDAGAYRPAAHFTDSGQPLVRGDAAPAEAGQDPAEADQDEKGSAIVVTGTRIRLPNLESFEPTVTVSERFIENRNLTNAADALNEQPVFRRSITPSNDSQSGLGQGVNFVNAFGLGSNRTLTLVNGRRFVSSNPPSDFGPAAAGTQVDLNIIPTALIDRIDFVSVGGAPVYGSDAISGTVNVILKTRYSGLELNALSGITEQGDNFRYNLSAVVGRNFGDGRGNVTLAVSHDKVEGVLQTSRAFLREGVDWFNNPSSASVPASRTPQNDLRVNPNVGFNNGPNDGNPPQVLARRRFDPNVSLGGVINLAPGSTGVSGQFEFGPNGELRPIVFGVSYPGPFLAGGEGGFRFEDFRQITSNVRRTTANLLANFDLSSNVTAFFEGTYYNSRTDELVELPFFNYFFFGDPLLFTVDNPFLSQATRQALINRGVGQFYFSRLLTELADQTGYADTNLYRGVVGLRGNFRAAGREFNWEVSANHGRNEIDDFTQDIDVQKFSNAINVTRNAAGQIVCDPKPLVNAADFYPAPIADAACVPLNLFGAGAPSQAARDYVRREVHTESLLKQTVFNANIGGTLFDLWAGPIAFNLGYEHRTEEARTVPDQFRQTGNGRYFNIPVVAGEYNVDEAFGELLVPLVDPERDLSFIHRAELFARGRYVDNSLTGGFVAWSAGGSFSPVRDVEFRGNYTRSFRAPAILELFSPVNTGLVRVPDICANPNSGPVPDIRQRNCQVFLARYPKATPLLASQLSVAGRSGGNPNLRNEKANSFTYGVILRPSFLPRFSASVDYINVEILNPISSLDLDTIAEACFDNPNFDADDPANGNQFCSLIPRDAQGQVTNNPQNPVVVGFVNGKRIKFSGVQATLNYSVPLDWLGLSGKLDLGADLLNVRRRMNDVTGIAPRRSDGELGDPKWSGQLRVAYEQRKWGISSSFNYVGKQYFSRQDRTRDDFEIPELDAFVTVNAGIHFDPAENFRLNLSVTNLFNRYGQRYYGVIIPDSYNGGAGGDLLGRRFAASARIRF